MVKLRLKSSMNHHEVYFLHANVINSLFIDDYVFHVTIFYISFWTGREEISKFGKWVGPYPSLGQGEGVVLPLLLEIYVNSSERAQNIFKSVSKITRNTFWHHPTGGAAGHLMVPLATWKLHKIHKNLHKSTFGHRIVSIYSSQESIFEPELQFIFLPPKQCCR